MIAMLCHEIYVNDSESLGGMLVFFSIGLLLIRCDTVFVVVLQQFFCISLLLFFVKLEE